MEKGYPYRVSFSLLYSPVLVAQLAEPIYEDSPSLSRFKQVVFSEEIGLNNCCSPMSILSNVKLRELIIAISVSVALVVRRPVQQNDGISILF